MIAQAFDVCHQVPGSVFFETCVGRALPRAALIEEHYTVDFRIKVATIVGRDPATGSTVKKHRRLTRRVTNLLIIELMNWRYLQPAGIEGLNFGIQGFHGNMIRRPGHSSLIQMKCKV